MKKLLISIALTGLSLHASAEALFNPTQLKQVAEIRQQAMQSPLAYEILTSLTTETVTADCNGEIEVTADCDAKLLKMIFTINLLNTCPLLGHMFHLSGRFLEK